MFNYGTVSITTASTAFNFDYIDKPNEFKNILNNQIEKYDDDRIENKQKNGRSNEIINKIINKIFSMLNLCKAKGRDKLFLLKNFYQVYKYTCNNLKYSNYTILNN